MKKLLLILLNICLFTGLQAQEPQPVIKAVTPLGPATWGYPDQPFGRRRPVTAADKAAIASYRQGKTVPIFSENFNDAAKFAANWTIKSDDLAALKSCRTPASVIVNADGLTLKTLPVTGHKSAWSTGSIWSNFRQKYGFFECRMKVAPGSGLNNAIWLTTDDSFEIDITEAKYPSYSHMTLHQWKPVHQSVGFMQKFTDDLSVGYHDYGLLWTPKSLIYSVDGEPVAALDISDSIKGTAGFILSTALADFAGKVPANPLGLDMKVKWVHVFAPARPNTAAHTLETGIDYSGLSSQNESMQEKVFGDIQSLHATWFRDGPTSGSAQGVANFVGLVKTAKQHKLKVLVNIVQMDEDYDHPETLPNWRIGNRVGWKEKKLSQINLVKFTARLRNLFGALKAANLTVDAVEFGNEDDTYAYDADVPNGHAASPEELKTWLRGYGQFLKTGTMVLHDPRYFPQAKIITFGMAHVINAWDNPPHHLEQPAGVVALLRNVDGYNYLDNFSYHVDGYGSHIYASNDINTWVTHIMDEDAAALGHDKPFWITEWGFTDPKAFPNKKGQTLDQCMEGFLNTFDSLHQKVIMGPVLFYAYKGWLADSAGKLLPLAAELSNYHESGKGNK